MVFDGAQSFLADDVVVIGGALPLSISSIPESVAAVVAIIAVVGAFAVGSDAVSLDLVASRDMVAVVVALCEMVPGVELVESAGVGVNLDVPNALRSKLRRWRASEKWGIDK